MTTLQYEQLRRTLAMWRNRMAPRHLTYDELLAIARRMYPEGALEIRHRPGLLPVVTKTRPTTR